MMYLSDEDRRIIANTNKDDLKALLPQVVEHVWRVHLETYGRGLIAPCLFPACVHNRSHSFRLTPSSSGIWYYHCSSCNADGDVFKFLMKLYPIGFEKVCQELALGFHGAGREIEKDMLSGNSTPPDQKTRQKILEAAVEVAHARLTFEDRTYLYGRGIVESTVEKFKIGKIRSTDGFVGALEDLGADRGFSTADCFHVGLLRESHNQIAPYVSGAIVMPILRGGRTVDLDAMTFCHPDWRVKRSTYVALRNAPGTAKRPYVSHDAKGADEIFLVKGMFDWLAVRQFGIPAIATRGAYNWPTECDEYLGSCKRVYVALGDSQICRHIPDLIPFKHKVFQCHLPARQDVNDLLVDHGSTAFLKEIKKLKKTATPLCPQPSSARRSRRLLWADGARCRSNLTEGRTVVKPWEMPEGNATGRA